MKIHISSTEREITIAGLAWYHSRIARDLRTSAIILNGI